MEKWSRAMYQPCIPLGENGLLASASEKHRMLAAKAAREGIVLLKNDGILPFSKGVSIACFGKGFIDYVYGGGGSGEVFTSEKHSVVDGLLAKEKEGKISVFHGTLEYYDRYVSEMYSKGYVPGLVKEPELPDDLVDTASVLCDVAVVFISRFSGEDWDRKSIDYPVIDTDDPYTRKCLSLENEIFDRSDFYLSSAEEAMLLKVLDTFENVVAIVNAGGMVDVSWIRDKYGIKAGMLVFQGGQMGGIAIADILVGDAFPSGKLTDTYALRLEDYPSSRGFNSNLSYVEYDEDIFVGYRYFMTIPGGIGNVAYPFGHGMSYTEFVLTEQSFSFDISSLAVSLGILVENIGQCDGKEVVQVYVAAPSGKIDKPSYVLASFEKTSVLHPGESSLIRLKFSLEDISSFDDIGIISKSSWILEAGKYRIFYGNSSVSLKQCVEPVVLTDDIILEKCHDLIVPKRLSRRLLANGTYESLKKNNDEEERPYEGNCSFVEPVSRCQIRRTREEMSERYEKGLISVYDGKMAMSEFLSSLDIETMIDLTGGQPNKGVANTYGFGNQPDYGIPSFMTADGPAGLRILPECGVATTFFPCMTMMASTWNQDLMKEFGSTVATEVKENNISVWLAPAVNIHRSPLCGRNFEYFSEDPLLTGIMASAVVEGIQSIGISACIKHFACNEKETNRKESDSIVSQRAAREIYLRPFEIIVRKSHPHIVMSSYNKINGIRCSENYELLTTLLRCEWGFDGMVVSDWWNHGEQYKELLAGNDLKMPSGDPEKLLNDFKNGLISKNDLAINVERILRTMFKLA